MKRRNSQFLLQVITGVFCASALITAVANDQSIKISSIQKKFKELETSSGGRIGVFAINTADNSRIQYRSNERFPIQSTFKVMLVSAILKRCIDHPHWLQQRIIYKKDDLVFWSPITEKNLAKGMTIAKLCEASLRYSDNAATNLLVKKLGGPHAVTNFARSMGDNTFRIEDWEPNLNSNPQDLHDTSTPLAMQESLQKLTLGHVLSERNRNQLVKWMIANTTGDKRIRAGVPKKWIVADKTGSGSYGITNDIGVVWPPHGKPIVVAIYFSQNNKNAVQRDPIIARATQLLIQEFYPGIDP